ncbi:hypothetical protein [Botrimarina sp.]|uniref:hypothetical protein n=1 Tax=Botrimarina sp. TaxID=2795802 RepID=UPI0032EDD72F
MRTVPLTVAWVGMLLTPGSAQPTAPEGLQRLRYTTAVACDSEPCGRRPPLLVHFHGAPPTVEPAFREAGLAGVLLTINCNGLSGAYREPFENAELFPYLLDKVRDDLVAEGRLSEGAEWGRVDLSFFSAGYGAARELLKQPAVRDRLDALVSADSIYASIHSEEGKRRVDAEQMAPFVAFARRAADGDAAFLWTHSQLSVEPYASTVETSDYLIDQLQLTRRELTAGADAFSPISEAAGGGLVVRGYPGADGEAHMLHLRRIADAWAWLASIRDAKDRP